MASHRKGCVKDGCVPVDPPPDGPVLGKREQPRNRSGGDRHAERLPREHRREPRLYVQRAQRLLDGSEIHFRLGYEQRSARRVQCEDVDGAAAAVVGEGHLDGGLPSGRGKQADEGRAQGSVPFVEEPIERSTLPLRPEFQTRSDRTEDRSNRAHRKASRSAPFHRGDSRLADARDPGHVELAHSLTMPKGTECVADAAVVLHVVSLTVTTALAVIPEPPMRCAC